MASESKLPLSDRVVGLSSADEVTAFLDDAFGARAASFLATLPRLVTHVSAVHGHADELYTMRVTGPDCPRSKMDFFMLNLTRAAADAVVATGQILRDEPHYTTQIRGPFAAALWDWRLKVGERALGNCSVMLTRTPSAVRGLSHTLFAHASPAEPVKPPHLAPPTDSFHAPVVLCIPPDQAAAALQSARSDGAVLPLDCVTGPQRTVPAYPQLFDTDGLIARGVSHNVFVHGLDAQQGSGPRAFVDFVTGPLAARSLSLEAGPQTTLPLYRKSDGSWNHAHPVDALLLTVYSGPLVGGEVRDGQHALLAGPFLRPREIEAGFELLGQCAEGDWLFQVWSRRMAPAL